MATPTPDPGAVTMIGHQLYRCLVDVPRNGLTDEVEYTFDTSLAHRIASTQQAGELLVFLEGIQILNDGLATIGFGCSFAFSVRDHEQLIEQGHQEDGGAGELQVDQTLAAVVLGISLSTLRGVLSGTLQQTGLKHLYLPVVNPRELLQGPLLDLASPPRGVEFEIACVGARSTDSAGA